MEPNTGNTSYRGGNVRNVLFDTGALVALLDRSEKNHAPCLEFFEGFHGRLLSTEPVLTEAIYLCAPSAQAQKACIDFFLKGAAVLVPQSPRSLSRIAVLMEKYQNVPMDFADATLVALGEEAQIRDVFTLDRRGFGVYRLHSKKLFTIWPE